MFLNWIAIEAYELTSEQLKSSLEVSIEDFGTLGVERTKDSTCANMNFMITFLDKPGDRPLMTVNSIQFHLWKGPIKMHITQYRNWSMFICYISVDTNTNKNTTTVSNEIFPTHRHSRGQKKHKNTWGSDTAAPFDPPSTRCISISVPSLLNWQKTVLSLHMHRYLSDINRNSNGKSWLF